MCVIFSFIVLKSIFSYFVSNVIFPQYNLISQILRNFETGQFDSKFRVWSDAKTYDGAGPHTRAQA